MDCSNLPRSFNPPHFGWGSEKPRTSLIRSVKLGILVVVAVGFLFSTPVAADEGSNLLTNQGCDADDGSGAPPDGWMLVSINVQCTDPMAVGGPPTPDGSDAFTDFSGDDSDAIVQQEVGVTGRTEYKLGGEIGTSESSDYARIEVEYLDGDGTQLDDGSVTREVAPAVDAWETFEDSSVAPPEATSAVVRITLVDNGGTSYSDAYLNELSFESGPYAGGDGSGSDPYEIANWHHLDNVRDNLGAEFVLTADLDADTAGYEEIASSGANGGDGFDPIGGEGNQFTGTFDGNGYTISNLFIDRTGGSIGVFGYTSGSTIETVALEDVDITGDGETVAGLVGHNDGTVTESYATGTVSISNPGDGDATGGLVGRSHGTVTKSYATAEVSPVASDGGSLGGLVGENEGTVRESYAAGFVRGVDPATNPSTYGGLVGSNTGTVEDSYWDTEETDQDDSAGGIGLTTAEMTGDDAAENMVGFDFDTAGDQTWGTTTTEVFGVSAESYPLLQATTQSDPSGAPFYAGNNEEPYEIETWYHLDNVRENLDSEFVLKADLDEDTAGYDEVASSSANGGNGFEPIGVSNFEGGPSFEGTFDGNGHQIRDLTVNRGGREGEGLFGGTDGARISNVSLVDADIDGGDYTGGIVGEGFDGEISGVSVSGDVAGGNSAGGLIGESYVPISDSYVTANVTSESNTGGIVGYQAPSGSVTDAYATGTIDGDRADRTGGVIGYRAGGTVENAYWDEDTTGAARGIGDDRDGSGGTTGLTTDEMQGASAEENMAFDWVDTWQWVASDHPVLQWEAAAAGDGSVSGIDARNTSIDAGESGTITVLATDEFGNKIGSETISVNKNDDALSGITVGAISDTDQDGEATFSFEEATSGLYTIEFSAEDASITDTATVSVEAVPPPAFADGYPTTSNVGIESFDIDVEVNESGIASYVVVEDGSGEPSVDQVRAGENADGANARASGSDSIDADTEKTFSVGGLGEYTYYDVYVVVEDDAGNANNSTRLTALTNAEGGLPVYTGFDQNSPEGWLFYDRAASNVQVSPENDPSLLLTEDEKDQKGTALYGKSFSATEGSTTEFRYYSDGETIGGADGISFMLLNASIVDPERFETGAPGGSLGYSGADGQSGVPGGFLGIGFDEWGNFANEGECHEGGYDTRDPGVTVRGAGDEGPPDDDCDATTNNYPFLEHQDPSQSIDTGWRDVRITTDPTAGASDELGVRVEMSFDGGDSWETVIDSTYAEGEIGSDTPERFYLGFSASTGGSTNVHAVDDLTVNQPVDLSTTVTDAPDGEYLTGDTVEYTFEVENRGPNDDDGVTLAPTVAMGDSGLQNLQWDTDGDGSFDDDAGSSTSLRLDDGETKTITLRGTVDDNATGDLDHEIEASPGTGFSDPNPSAATSSVAVDLGPEVTGTLRDGLDDGAIAQEGIEVVADTGSGSELATETDENGQFSILIASDTEYTLSATAIVDEEFEIANETTIDAGETTDRDLTLGPDYDGAGTEGDPYLIGDAEDLQQMRYDVDAHYELSGDVDASDTETWFDGSGFEPIGHDGTPFTGTFDGGGYGVSNLAVNRSDEDESGLFGHVGDSGSVTNLTVDGEFAGASAVGIVAGVNDGTVAKTTVNGSVDGSTVVGGVVGQNDGIISNVSADVNATGDDHIGGLAGNNTDTDGSETVIRDSFAVGEVTTSGDGGGLVGENEEPVTDAYWNTETSGLSEAVGTGGGGAIDARGLTTEEMQGLNGWFFMQDVIEEQPKARFGNLNYEHVLDPWIPTEGYPTLVTDSDGDTYTYEVAAELLEENGDENEPYTVRTVGELQAVMHNVNNHYVLENDIDASGTEHWNDGEGFEPISNNWEAGYNSFAGSFDGQGHTVSNLTITPSSPGGNSIDTRANKSAWGLFDTINPKGEVRNVALEDVHLEYQTSASESAGGVVGSNGGTVENVSVSGYVAGGSITGGVVGTNDPDDPDQEDATIRNATSTATVTSVSREDRDVGGLAGVNRDVIERSVASGEVQSNDTSEGYRVNVGGFVGDNDGGTVTDSRMVGNVESDGINEVDELNVGGFVGDNGGDKDDGTITGSYATGNVRSDGRNEAGELNVGGFAGDNGDTIRESYALGDVQSDELVGGAVEGLEANVGGFVGDASGGTVADSYAVGEVHSGERNDAEELTVGGFAGNVVGTIERSYAIGPVTVDGDEVDEDTYVGGFVGLNGEDGVEGAVVDSYWDADATGQAASDGDASGLTTVQMQRFAPLEHMDGLRFRDDGTWTVTDEYPALAWQDVDELTVTSIDAQDTTTTAGEDTEVAVTVDASDGDRAGEGVTVTVSDADGLSGIAADTAITDENGEATFPLDEADAGEYDPEFAWADDETVSAVADVTVAPGAVDSVEIKSNPDGTQTAGDVLTGTPSVTVTDAYDNPIEDESVTVGATGGAGDITGGTTTVRTDERGDAVFDDLKIQDADESYRLKFTTSDEQASVESDRFEVDAAVAATLTTIDAPSSIEAGEELTLTVEARDEYGNPAAEQAIESVVIASEHDGTVADVDATTLDANGRAAITIAPDTIVTTDGDHTLTVTGDDVTGDSTSINVKPGTPEHVTFDEQPASTTAGETVTAADGGDLTVSVRDRYGNLVADQDSTVNVSVLNVSGAVVSASETVAPDGVVDLGETRVTRAGEYRLEASGEDASLEGTEDAATDSVLSDAFRVDPAGPAEIVSIDGIATTQTAGETITDPVRGTVTDEYGNAISGHDVTIAVNGTLEDGTTHVTTDASGVAEFDDLVIEDAGTYEATVTADTIGSTVAVGEFTVDPAAPDTVSVRTQPGDTEEHSEIPGPPAVTVVDAYDNPVADSDVTVEVNGSFSAGQKTVTTNEDGNAVFAGLELDSPGEYRLRFNASGVTNATSDAFTVDSEPRDPSPSDEEPERFSDSDKIRDEFDLPENVSGEYAERVGSEVSNGKTSVKFSDDSPVVRIESTGVSYDDSSVIRLDANRIGAEDPPGTLVSVTDVRVPDELADANATIRYRVSTDHLNASRISAEDISLYRYADGEWEQLTTIVVGETDDSVHFRAETPGFSLIGASATSEPNAEISELRDTVEPGESFMLNASDSATEHGQLTAYEWIVANETLNGETTDTSIPDVGTYDVSLTVTNDAGRTDTTSATMTVENASTDTDHIENDTTEDKTTEPESPSDPAEETSGFGVAPALGVLLLAGILLAVRTDRTN